MAWRVKYRQSSLCPKNSVTALLFSGNNMLCMCARCYEISTYLRNPAPVQWKTTQCKVSSWDASNIYSEFGGVLTVSVY